MGDAAEKRNVVPLVGGAPRRVRGHHVGQLVGWEERGPRVTCAAAGKKPLSALTTVPLDADAVASAMREGGEVLLVFEGERADRPVIVGLLAPPVAPVAPLARQAPGTSPAPSSPAPRVPVATVDGKRVVLNAEDEIVLQCGEASITLRRNGRVVIRGAYVETRSRGVNRIKGGSVQIN